VQLIGSRLIEGQPITDSRVGLGDRLIQVTAGAATAVGTVAGLAVSAPLAIVDPNTRNNIADHTEELGRSLRSTSDAVTE
jgi:esterase/lipase superfamily enzyme